jgi:hypothetical protein
MSFSKRRSKKSAKRNCPKKTKRIPKIRKKKKPSRMRLYRMNGGSRPETA